MQDQKYSWTFFKFYNSLCSSAMRHMYQSRSSAFQHIRTTYLNTWQIYGTSRCCWYADDYLSTMLCTKQKTTTNELKWLLVQAMMVKMCQECVHKSVGGCYQLVQLRMRSPWWFIAEQWLGLVETNKTESLCCTMIETKVENNKRLRLSWNY